MRPHQRHRLASLAQHDHFAVAPRLERDGATSARGLEADPLVVGISAEVDDRARGDAAHLRHQRVVGVQDREAGSGHRLDDHLLHLGKALDGVDPA